ncbi:HEPN domain-containing protein [Ferroplasma sp.]|uniref:HEPN domain-containing protein n=1 Tax=Ferroplasma sp. TaxID=2591003 RepID=UPI00307E6A48
MTFEWEDYLTLAIELKKNVQEFKLREKCSLEEAIYRSSISRSYYFIFHYSKNYLETYGRHFKKTADVHREICDAFEELSMKNDNEEIRKDLIEISENLTRLRIVRNMADYDGCINNIEEEAEASIIVAQNTKEILGRLNLNK